MRARCGKLENSQKEELKKYTGGKLVARATA